MPKAMLDTRKNIVRDLKYIRRYYKSFRLLDHSIWSPEHDNGWSILTLRRHTIAIKDSGIIRLSTTYKKATYTDISLIEILAICLKCKDRKAFVW